MPRRAVLTERQRAALFDLPTDEAALVRHYTLSDDDLTHIRRRRRPQNRLGFALQLCALRYPGRLLQPGEVIPEAVLAFIGAQIGVASGDLLDYGAREATRYTHSSDLQRLYDYRPFEGLARREIAHWLTGAAEAAQSNDGLAAALLAELRDRRIIAPGISILERFCADALVAAERRIEARIADRLDSPMRVRLLQLLADKTTKGVTRLVWLRDHEPGHNSRDANRLMDRLEWIRALHVSVSVTEGVAPHRVARLRRQGERYYADGLRDLPHNRKLAILAACVTEWRATIADAIVETHDRIVGRLYRSAERASATQIADQRAAVEKTLTSFAEVGASLVAAKEAEKDLDGAVDAVIGWEKLSALVETAVVLTAKIAADPLDFVGMGYARFRLYAPRLLDMLDLRATPAAEPLLHAIDALRSVNASGPGSEDMPITFARPKWRKRLAGKAGPDRRMWEIAILFAIRDALRSGDIWLEESRRHRDIGTALLPTPAMAAIARLAVPLDAQTWLDARRTTLAAAIEEAGVAAARGLLPNGAIQDGAIKLEKLERNDPDGAENLVLDLYGRLPPTRITNLLLQVDDATGFSEVFVNLRTGAPCRDRIGLLTVLLADGVNLGLKKMAAATDTHTFWELIRIARWHIEDDAYRRALAMIVEAQDALPLAAIWGGGVTSSSDGQFFPAGGHGEAMNLVNAKYGTDPGLKAYTHISDRFAPFATQTIPATVHEAPFILDGLLMNEAGRRIREHYADTGGFTDHVFATCAILGFVFAPRIRDLPSK